MSDQNGDGSGTQGSDDAPKNDYVISGPESEMEKAAKAAEAVGAPKAKKPEPSDDEDDGEDDADGEDDPADSGKAKKQKRGGFQKKIERLQAENAALQARLSGNQPEKPSPEKSENAKAEKPKPEEFETYDDYVEALTDWKTEQALNKRDETRQADTKKSEFKKSQETKAARYEKGVEAAQEKYDDFDDVIEDYDGPFTIGMQQALLDSDIGPEIAYHLAKHPEEAEKLAKMNLIELNKAVAKIEARIELQSGKDEEGDEPTEKADKAAAKTTKSPPPIKPVKGTSGSQKDPGEMSYEEYQAWKAKRHNR